MHADSTKVDLIFVKYTNKAASPALVLRYLQLRCRSCNIAGTLLPPRGYQKCCMQRGVTTFLLGQYSHKSMLIKTQADSHKLIYFFISFIENFHLSTSVFFFLQLLPFFFFFYLQIHISHDLGLCATQSEGFHYQVVGGTMCVFLRGLYIK